MAVYKSNSADIPYLAPLPPQPSASGISTSIQDYMVDWTDELATGESISGSAWSIDGNAEQPAATGFSPQILSGNKKTVIYLQATSGAAAGDEVTVTNQITTSATPKPPQNRSFKIKILNR